MDSRDNFLVYPIDELGNGMVEVEVGGRLGGIGWGELMGLFWEC
jgi:hypothetical protein